MLGIMPTTEGVCPFGDHRFEYELKPGQRPVYCSPQHAWKASAQRQKARKAGLERRVCGRCKKKKPREQFGGPTNPYCRPCHTEYERERRQLNGQQNPGYTRALNLRRYGLTLQQVEIMLASQNGRCAICRTDAPGGQGWHVDHDHSCCNTRKKSCGRCTRGLLCSRCNIAIGNLRDDPVIIQAALDYVRLHHDRIACIPPAASRATQPLPRKFTKDVT